MPSPACRFSNEEWFSAAQTFFGSAQSACLHLVGTQITNHPNCKQASVCHFGSNLKSVVGVRGDGIRHLHDQVVNKLSEFLRRCRCPHQGGEFSQRHTATGFFVSAMTGLSNNRSDEATTLKQGIIPDIITPANSLKAGQLEAIYDVKTLSDSASSYHTAHPENAVEVRATAVRTTYARNARNLDKMLGHTGTEPGLIAQRLFNTHTGNVIGLVVGSFGRVSESIHTLIKQIAERLAKEQCRNWLIDHDVALGLITRQLNQELGTLIHKGWARLMLDRLQNNTQRSNHISSGHMDYELEETRGHNMQFPDTYA